MYVGFALFRFKKGQGKFAMKHMREHLRIVQQVKGFIHGYVAKSVDTDHEYLVIEEYETTAAQEKAQELIAKDLKKKPVEYIKFTKILQEKPRIEVFRKREMTHTKISPEYKKIMKKVMKNR